MPDDDLPRIKHTLRVYEDGPDLVIDISDETGGLGIRIYMSTLLASQFGQRLADRARLHAAAMSDNPTRQGTDEFSDIMSIRTAGLQ